MATFLNSNATSTVTFSSIPYAQYEVITYVGAEGGGENGRTASVSSGSGPTFFFQTSNANNDPYTYTQITNTTSGPSLPAITP